MRYSTDVNVRPRHSLRKHLKRHFRPATLLPQTGSTDGYGCSTCRLRVFRPRHHRGIDLRSWRSRSSSSPTSLSASSLCKRSLGCIKVRAPDPRRVRYGARPVCSRTVRPDRTVSTENAVRASIRHASAPPKRPNRSWPSPALCSTPRNNVSAAPQVSPPARAARSTAASRIRDRRRRRCNCRWESGESFAGKSARSATRPSRVVNTLSMVARPLSRNTGVNASCTTCATLSI